MRTSTAIRNGKSPLYEDVAGKIGTLIDQGTFRPGERVPSVRNLSRQMQVSVNTVIEAYSLLENRRVIEARPQSGYYVCSRLPEPEPRQKEPDDRDFAPNPVNLCEIAVRIMCNIQDASLVPLGAAVPNPDFLPIDKLNRMLAAETRRFRLQSVSYPMPSGLKRLRTQIAKRAISAGCTLGSKKAIEA